ncbi:RNA methyltransferase [Flavipsychrobacter stenotrophus]|uniref:RNA methyltransferase n=1 Tax=Flavipsychrobacter stenotrophus TaxID=2077091 RepID=A0A2S7STF9_9BACT|nr:RNA methyltransferase [Flavipsychrobacter stenotrophus]PQJ10222.1 RNA methyltransferase [Flavipsychrobacter stenotrophus]
MQKKTMEELGRLSAEDMRQATKHPIIVILDEVRSMHNVGSVFRTCDGFAVEALYLCGYTPLPPHRDIHKTALGATESVTWQHFATTMEAINHCKAEGYKILAVEQAHNSISLQNLQTNNEKIALVFGNEVAGVNEEAIKAADACIEIPQWGSKHSLNISVAVGVVLWEIARGMA